MYCRKCGNEVPETDKFCASCGEVTNGTDAPEQGGTKGKKQKKVKTKGQKMASNIGWGIFGLFLFAGIFGDDSTSTSTTTTPSYSAAELVDYKNDCGIYDYEAIFRDSGDYKGKKATFTGKVVQVQYSGSRLNMRVNVTRSESTYGTYVTYNDTLWVTYTPEANESRVLEDDIITIYGELTGTYSYKSVLGGEITIPSIRAVIIEQSFQSEESTTEHDGESTEEENGTPEPTS